MVTKLAQATGYITVVDDVISIKSADVVFAIGSNNVNPPVDGDNWKTTFAELSMTSDGYVWTCTKITKTDDSVEYSGKYCLGACSDFASIIELYALGDSNTNPPADNVGWKQSYTPVKGKWLWTRNELHFQNSSEVVLTTPVCIGYFAEDGTNGTSFKFKGKASGYFDKASSMTNFHLYEYYLLDKDDVSEPNISSPCVGMYDRTGGVAKLRTYKADVGDAYRIDTSLWVNNGDEWVNFGDIQGPQGEAGEDAIWAVLSPRQITFESNEKGVVKDEVKYVDLTVFLGSTIITQSCNISFLDASGSNFNNSKATVVRTNSSTNILVQSTGIASKKIDDNLIITNPYSFLRVKVSYEDYVLTFDIGIVVDTSVQDGYFHTSINGLDAKYSKIKSSTDSLTTTVTTQQGVIAANSTNITLTNNQLKETNEIVNGINTTVSEWKEAGVITYKDYAGLFATYSKGEIATKAEMSVAIDNGISKATIDADRININAGHKLSVKGNYMTVDTDNFKLDENGDVEVNGNITNVGKDYTIKIDNGVIYFITPTETFHLGLNSNGKPDWLSNKPYVYTSTFYTGNLLSNPTSVTLYTTDNKTYYTDVNLTTKANGTYYSLKYSGETMVCSNESIYCVYAAPFAKVSLYEKYTFGNGIKTKNGFVATGYNFYMDDTGNTFIRYSSKAYFAPSQVAKETIKNYVTIKEIGSDGTLKDVNSENVDISKVSGSYIYPLVAKGYTEVVFNNYSTISQVDIETTYSVQNISI